MTKDHYSEDGIMVSKEHMSESELEMAKDVINELLVHNYIVSSFDDRSKSYHDFLYNNVRHREYVEDYLDLIGHTIEFGGAKKEVVHLVSEGLPGIVRFSKFESMLLLILYKAYLTNVQKISRSTNITVTVKVLLDLFNPVMGKEYGGIGVKKAFDEKSIKQAIYTFEQFRLVKVLEEKKKNFNRETAIEIMPSISMFFTNARVDEINARIDTFQQERKIWVSKGSGSDMGDDADDVADVEDNDA